MNLITDKWLQISNAKGEHEKVAIWDVSALCEKGSFLNFPRPNFNLSALMFLVGLMHIVRKDSPNLVFSATKPPSENELKKLLLGYASAFNLFGDNGPLFMQSMEAKKKDVIYSLFLDCARENAIKNQRDFLHQENTIRALCPSCAAISLYNLQMFAPTGGGGYYTSPLDGLLMLVKHGSSIWETVINNMVPTETLKKFGDPALSEDPQKIFLWMSPEKVPSADPKSTAPEHTFWFSPLLIRLIHKEEACVCSCCGEESPTCVTHFLKSNHGTQYASAERHPFAIYSTKNKEDEPTEEIALDVPEEEESKGESKKNKSNGEVKVTFQKTKYHVAYGILTNPAFFKPELSQQGDVSLCGVFMAQANYISWLDKKFWFDKDRTEDVNSLLSIQEKAVKKTQGKVTPENGFQTSDLIYNNMEPLFYKLLKHASDDMMQQWAKALMSNCLLAFDKFSKYKMLRKDLENDLCTLLLKAGIENPEEYVTEELQPKRKRRYLSTEACTAILNWWAWLNNYSKATKTELMNVSSCQDLLYKEAYERSLLSKVIPLVLPGEEHPDQKFLDRFALAAYLSLHVRHDPKIHLKQLLRNQGGQLATLLKNEEEAKRAVQNKCVNVISIFNSILF